ncbi:NAD(P)-binding domain-containing protein [Agromyces sp. G08B096]|uniref:NAD(P)-binding domain-containing protein n=1 Tax=Agromyces sp. G08B096 TaxID=3156399 RepID=A0AAU7W8T9_9MICO
MTHAGHSQPSTLKIAILGTGNVAQALGAKWAAHGHEITIGGRSIEKARAAAAAIGCGVAPSLVAPAVEGADVVLLAVPWAAVDDVLAQAGAPTGALASQTIIDPTNPVAHGVGRHLLATGSAAEHIASHAPGAHVVKAFNVHPATYWDQATPRDVVTIAGSSRESLELAGMLVRHVGATPHPLGGLDRARQLEEFAATVIALAFGGIDPKSSVPGSH